MTIQKMQFSQKQIAFTRSRFGHSFFNRDTSIQLKMLHSFEARQNIFGVFYSTLFVRDFNVSDHC
jgi:hypothetical protein